MTTQPTPDYTFTPPGFPPNPMIDGVRWYYVRESATSRVENGDKFYSSLGEVVDADGPFVGEFVHQANYNTLKIIRRIPAEPVSISEKIIALGNTIPDEIIATLPRDGASQVDHYVYGAPKREEPAPGYPAGLPPGLVRLEGGFIERGYTLVHRDGSVSEAAHRLGTVEQWIACGDKSAVYRKPEAKPPADATLHDWNVAGTSIKEDLVRVKESVSKNNGLQFRHLFPSTLPAIMPPTDHIGDATEMVHHIGEANEMIDNLTAELARLAGERDRAVRALTNAGFVDNGAAEWKPPVNVDAFAPKWADAQAKVEELESELARLKAPVEVEEFGEIAGKEWINSAAQKRLLRDAIPRLLREVVELREYKADIERHLVRIGLIGIVDDGRPKDFVKALASAPDNDVTKILDEVVKAADLIRTLRARVEELETPIRIKSESDVYYIIPDGRGGFTYATPEEIAAAKGVEDVSK